MPDATARIQTDERGRHTLRLQRVLPHDPDQIWEALTTAAELQHWHPSPFEFERRVGGRVRYLAPLAGTEMPDGEVLDYDPPRVLAYTWGDDELRWELEPGPAGCLLVLTHTFDDRLKAARDAAGWELCLQALSGHLDSGGAADPGPEPGPDRAIPEGWSELNRAYEQRFGIAPEDATPPPR